MFDDPKKQLRRLEEELRAVEPEETEPEEAYEEPDPDDWEPGMGPGYNPAVDFGRMLYADEQLDEDAVFVSGKKGSTARRKAKKTPSGKESREPKKNKKRRPFGGQLLLALLEIGLIVVIVRWWLEWIT